MPAFRSHPSPPPELVAQPGAGDPPVAARPCHRDPERRGDLGDGQAAEVPQGDDLGLAPVQRGQPVERLVDRDDVQALLLEVVHHRVERDAPHAPAAPGGGPPPGVVDEHLPHRPRGRGEQVAAVRRPVEDRLAQQPDDGLVDDRGGRERVAGVLPAASGASATRRSSS